TGIRCARTAPRISPMANAPAMAIPDTSSVRTRPPSSARQFSERNDQSKERASIRGVSGRRTAAAHGRSALRALRRRVVFRVVEDLLRAQDVLREGGEEPRGNARLHDRVERVALAHDVEPRVDPTLHRVVALLDADP